MESSVLRSEQNNNRVAANSASSPTGSTPNGPRLVVDLSDLTIPVQATPRSLQPEELRRLFLVSLEKMFTLEPESIPFRQPVDPELLGIPDYHDIVRRPMDLQTIRMKMNCLKYMDPWMFVDDVLLMFDNAWLYNRPLSRVYKYCTRLCEVFLREINPVMQRLGYKYGRIMQYNSQTLSCFGRPVCLIGKDETYYNFLRFHLCEKCYLNNMTDDGIKLPWQNNIVVSKENFVQLVNDTENSYSPAAEMHRSYLRDAEMSRQLVIREFFRLLGCSKTGLDKKQNIVKMLRLNSQLRNEFLLQYQHQQSQLPSNELKLINEQISDLRLSDSKSSSKAAPVAPNNGSNDTHEISNSSNDDSLLASDPSISSTADNQNSENDSFQDQETDDVSTRTSVSTSANFSSSSEVESATSSSSCSTLSSLN